MSRDTQALLKTVAEYSPDHVMLLDHQLRVQYANRGLLGKDAQALLNQPIGDLMPDDKALLESALNSTLASAEPATFETQHLDGQGHLHFLETRAVRLPPHPTKGLAQLHLTTTDITQRVKYEQELRQAAAFFSQSREAILILDSAGRIQNINSAFQELTGYRLPHVSDKRPRMLLAPGLPRNTFRHIIQYVSHHDYWQEELKISTRDCRTVDVSASVSAIKNDQGIITTFVILLMDISRQKQHQKHLERIAHFDTLTHLPNRILLGKRLNDAMTQAKSSDSRLAVLYIDLDGFKTVNDRHGHQIGDRLLMDIARRMESVLHERDTLGRLGGDEFMVIVPDIDSRPRRNDYFYRILQAISLPVHSEAGVIEVSASLGVAYYPHNDHLEAEQLIRQADLAMFKAKINGKNRFEIFDPARLRNLHDAGHLESELQRALEHNQFSLLFQPKVNMSTGAVLGAEALLRWRHPQRGLLSPNEFLRAGLSDELVVALDRWVINHCLHQISQWKSDNHNVKVSINLTLRTLEQTNFSTELAKLLLNFPEINPSLITFEVLESSAVEDVNLVSLVMRATSALGIGFSLDDFGTGYSTLNLLKKLPAREMKVDRSFVHDMLANEDDLTIIRGIMGLAKAFDKQVVAEGVESEQHGLALMKLGCVYGQGYAIAPPLEPAEFIHWSQRWQAFPSWLQSNPVPA